MNRIKEDAADTLPLLESRVLQSSIFPYAALRIKRFPVT